MGYWSHRVVDATVGGERTLTFAEVFYDDADVPECYGEAFVCVDYDEGIEALQRLAAHLDAAVALPVLRYPDDFKPLGDPREW